MIKNSLFIFCLSFSFLAHAELETVQPNGFFYSLDPSVNFSTVHYSDPQAACDAAALASKIPGATGAPMTVLDPLSTCYGQIPNSDGSLPQRVIGLVGLVYKVKDCPTPPNLPFFNYNNSTLLCERQNPCSGQPLLSFGLGLGSMPVGTAYSKCGLDNCTYDYVSSSSGLGMTIVDILREPVSCTANNSTTSTPSNPLTVKVLPPSDPLAAQSAAEKTVFDQLLADKAAADAKSAAAAAASANATAATAAQAAADQAAADAYIASVIARANALKAGLPVINAPVSPTSTPTGGGVPTTGGTNTTYAPATTGGAGGAGGTTGTANCATFSICNVEQYLQDIKNALGFGQSFDATAAAADAKIANMENDGQTALKKVGHDAATQEAADESLIKSAFQIPALRTTCSPITKIVMGRPLSIDLCFYTEIIRQIIAFLFGLFGAFTVYQIAFRKN